jgi:hypothetical protein
LSVSGIEFAIGAISLSTLHFATINLFKKSEVVYDYSLFFKNNRVALNYEYQICMRVFKLIEFAQLAATGTIFTSIRLI